VLEMRDVRMALDRVHLFPCMEILVSTDNTSVVTYINHQEELTLGLWGRRQGSCFLFGCSLHVVRQSVNLRLSSRSAVDTQPGTAETSGIAVSDSSHCFSVAVVSQPVGSGDSTTIATSAAGRPVVSATFSPGNVEA